MSEFDKEAEREKLREKYERDKEKRQSTQRMSELLLKGATMTNRHCEECGDPIFRYDGQEFCPTCQQTAQQAESAVEATEPTAAADTTEHGTDAGDVSTEDQNGGRTERDRPEPTATADIQADPTATESTDSTPVDRSPETPTENNQAQSTGGAVDQPRGDAVEHEGEGDLAAARASLVRSIERYAQAAERTDDPRQAKNHLAAAREAAETLAALTR